MVTKHGGPFNSTSAGLLNHQISKISINSIWMKLRGVGLHNGHGIQRSVLSIGNGGPGLHKRGDGHYYDLETEWSEVPPFRRGRPVHLE